MTDMQLAYADPPPAPRVATPAAADPWAAFPVARSASTPAASDPWAAFPAVQPSQSTPEYDAATEGHPLIVPVYPRGWHSVEVDYHDPDAVARADTTVQGAQPPTQIESLVRGALQGASLNLGDESRGLAEASGISSLIPGAQILGAGRLAAEAVAPGVFGQSATDRYDQAVSQERASNAAASGANPGAYLTGGLAGSLATLPALPAAAIVKGAGVAPMLTNAAIEGVGYGAAAGMGAGEGNPIERLPEAARGAAVGGVAGPVLTGAARAIGSAGSYVADHLAATRSPGVIADRVTGQALSRDGANVPALADRIRAASAQGQPLTLADVAGDNTRGLAGSVARFPGAARQQTREFLDARQFGNETVPEQADRIGGRIGALLGDDAGSIQAADDIIARRSAQVAPIYKAADAKPVDYASAPGRALKETLDRVPDGVLARANQIIEASGEGGHQLSLELGEGGRVQLTSLPNVRQWRYIRRGLDDAIDGTRDQFGRLSQYGRALTMLRKEIGESLSQASPAMAAADKVFAGESRLLDALRTGKDAFNPSTTPEALRKAVTGLSPGELEMFRLGAANALREKVGNAASGADKARLVFGTPNIRSKMAVLAPDSQAFGQFRTFLDNETQMVRTRAKATGNSATAERLTDDAETGEAMARAGHATAALLKGRVGPVIREAANYLSKVDPRKRGAVLKSVQELILTPNADTVRAFQARLDGARLGSRTRQRVVGAVTRALPQALTTTIVGSQGQ